MVTKTLEFKIKLSDSQLATVLQYLEISRQVWNYALGCLVDHEQFVQSTRDFSGEKPVWAASPCCPLPWKYRRIDYEKGWVEGNLAPFSPITDRKRPFRQCCPLPQGYREPKLGLTLLGKYSLQYHLAQKNHPDWVDLKTIGAWYVRGVCDSLFTAWTRYKKGDAGKPRFKRYNEQYTTLSYGDGAKIKLTPINAKDAQINIPKVGAIKVPYLYQDLGNLPIAVLRIVKKPDGWYIQMVCSKYPDTPESGNVTIGLVPVARDGILAIDDRGNEITVSPDERRLLLRKERLQQKAARQRRALLKMQREGMSVKGTNLKATERKIAKISALLAKRRKSEQQKVASFLARKSKAIAVVQPNAKFIPHPKPKPASGKIPIQYDPNGAERVAEANKERQQYAVGQFVEIIRQKTSEAGVDYTKVARKPKAKSNIDNIQSLAKAIKP